MSSADASRRLRKDAMLVIGINDAVGTVRIQLHQACVCAMTLCPRTYGDRGEAKALDRRAE